MRRTDWFRVDQEQPYHVGWYEVKSNAGGMYANGDAAWKIKPIVMRYWNGSSWEWDNPEIGRTHAGVGFGEWWRGLKAPVL